MCLIYFTILYLIYAIIDILLIHVNNVYGNLIYIYINISNKIQYIYSIYIYIINMINIKDIFKHCKNREKILNIYLYKHFY